MHEALFPDPSTSPTLPHFMSPQLETVQRLVREGMQLETSWTDEAQEQQLRDQIQKMQEEEDRCEWALGSDVV